MKLHICPICWNWKMRMILRVSCRVMKTWKTGRKLELLQKQSRLNKRHYDICTLNTCAFFEHIKRITFTPTRSIFHKSSYITRFHCHVVLLRQLFFYLYSDSYSLLLCRIFPSSWNYFIYPKQRKIIYIILYRSI